MGNKINVNLAGMDFSIISNDDAAYVRKVTDHVNQAIYELTENYHISLLHAALMTALNLGDDSFKAMDSAENLRGQLRNYLEESSRMKLELADVKRQLAKQQPNNG